MKGPALWSVLVIVFLMGAAFAGQDEAVDSAGEAQEADSSAVRIEMKAKEILTASCATSGCHAGEHPKMQLSLEAGSVPGDLIGAASKQNSKMMLIDTKNPEQSYLLVKITGGEEMKGKMMPLMKKPLTEEELSVIMAWIDGFASADEETVEEAPEPEEEDGSE